MNGFDSAAPESKEAAQATSKSAEQAGTRTAESLEAAVANNDKAAFHNALNEAVDFRASHNKGEYKQYLDAVRSKASADDMLPQLTVFANKTNFDILDKNGDQRITKDEQKNTTFNNELENELVNGYKSNDRPYGTDKYHIDSDLKVEAEKRAERANLRDLFKPGADGRSLYDKMKEKDGSVKLDTIQSCINVAGALNLSQGDKDVLAWFKGKTDGAAWFNTTSKEDLALMCSRAGLKMEDLQKGSAEKKTLNNQGDATAAQRATNLDLPQKDNSPNVDSSRSAGAATEKPSDGQAKEVATPRVIKTEAPELEQRRIAQRNLKEQMDDLRRQQAADQGRAEKFKLLAGDAGKPVGSNAVDKPVVSNKPGVPNAVDKPAVQNKPVAPNAADSPVVQNKPVAPNAADRPVVQNKPVAPNAADKPVDPNKPVDSAAADKPVGPAATEKPAPQEKVDSQEDRVKEREKANSMHAVKIESDSEAKIKEALTIKKGQSYSHCAERLLALAGEKDPSGQQIREVARQLWIADSRRKAGTLTTGQVLSLDESLRNNPSLKKLFKA